MYAAPHMHRLSTDMMRPVVTVCSTVGERKAERIYQSSVECGGCQMRGYNVSQGMLTMLARAA